MEIISKNVVEVNKLNLFVDNKLLLKDADFKIKRGRKVRNNRQ